jgi:pyruvate-formate lyase-activating enzyme
VFFQGGPLRCVWRQNPEGQNAGSILIILMAGCAQQINSNRRMQP